MSKKYLFEKELQMSENNITCAECGSKKVNTTWEDNEFLYGEIKIKVKVPARQCSICKFQFLDWESEDIMGKAVDDYLKEKE